MNRLTDADRVVIARRVRERYPDPNAAEQQVRDAVNLAVDLYQTAARYGISRPDADAVTSFISAAIDGIRMRDRKARR
jgi:hypothetical protein